MSWRASWATALIMASAVLGVGCKPKNAGSALRGDGSTPGPDEVMKAMLDLEMDRQTALAGGFAFIPDEALRVNCKDADPGCDVQKQTAKKFFETKKRTVDTISSLEDILKEYGQPGRDRRVAQRAAVVLIKVAQNAGYPDWRLKAAQLIGQYLTSCQSVNECTVLLTNLAELGNDLPVEVYAAIKGVPLNGPMPDLHNVDLLKAPFPDEEKDNVTAGVLGQLMRLERTQVREGLWTTAWSIYIQSLFYGSTSLYAPDAIGRDPHAPDDVIAALHGQLMSFLKVYDDKYAKLSQEELEDRFYQSMMYGVERPPNPEEAGEYQELKEAYGTQTEEDEAKLYTEVGIPGGDAVAGLILQQQGAVTLLMYLKRLGMKADGGLVDPRPWYRALELGGTETAFFTMVRFNKIELSLPYREDFMESLKRIAYNIPYVPIPDPADPNPDPTKARKKYVPKPSLQREFIGVNARYEAALNSLGGAYGGTTSPEDVDKAGLPGGLIGAIRPVQAGNDCQSSDVYAAYFAKRANDQDGQGRRAPLLMAAEVELAKKFPLFHSLGYQQERLGRFQHSYQKAVKAQADAEAEKKTVGTFWYKAALIPRDLIWSIYGGGKEFFQAAGDLVTGNVSVGPDAFQNILDDSLQQYLEQFLVLQCYNHFASTMDALDKDFDVKAVRPMVKTCALDQAFDVFEVCYGREGAVDKPLIPNLFVETIERKPEASFEGNVKNYLTKKKLHEIENGIRTQFAMTAFNVALMHISGGLSSGVTSMLGIPRLASALFLKGAVREAEQVALMTMWRTVPYDLITAAANNVAFVPINAFLTAGLTAAVTGDVNEGLKTLWDPRKTWQDNLVDNYGQHMASGVFVFFLQPYAGRVADRLSARLMGVRNSAELNALGFARMRDLLSKKKWGGFLTKQLPNFGFVSGADGLFFSSTGYMQEFAIDRVRGKNDEHFQSLEAFLDMVADKEPKGLMHSFLTAAAFRGMHGLGGHFDFGPSTRDINAAALKVIKSVERVNAEMEKLPSGSPQVQELMARERELIDKDTIDFSKILRERIAAEPKFQNKRWKYKKKIKMSIEDYERLVESVSAGAPDLMTTESTDVDMEQYKPHGPDDEKRFEVPKGPSEEEMDQSTKSNL